MLIVLTCQQGEGLRNSKWLANLRGKETVHVVSLSYDPADRKRRAPRSPSDAGPYFEQCDLHRGENLLSQANVVLTQIYGMFRQVGPEGQPLRFWILLDETFPWGLYEAIVEQSARDRDEQHRREQPKDEGRRPLLPKPQPFMPYMYRDPGQDPFTHKNPEKKFEPCDIEFCPDLLDCDERGQLETALINPRSVLITGGVGSGKTLLARYIHFHTADTAGAEFVEVNYAAIPENLVEAEFFGVAKGAATEVAARTGLIEAAKNGTLLLDEIAEATDDMKVKLLRVVSERPDLVRFRRVGETKTQDIRVRFLAATNVPLHELSKRLRPDLRSRFPLQIHLKNLDEKVPDPFNFYVRSLDYFTSLDLAFNPSLIPQWDQSALKESLDRGRLPHSLRELRLFVERVWDRRRSRGTPMADSVGAEEIAAALSTGGSASKHRELRAAKETPTIHLIKDLLSGIREEGGLEGLSALSEAEAQALVYCVKRFAFDLAVWYGGSNKAKQRRTYGMPNPKAFDKLVGDPEILRPDAKKRRK